MCVCLCVCVHNDLQNVSVGMLTRGVYACSSLTDMELGVVSCVHMLVRDKFLIKWLIFNSFKFFFNDF